jgi:HIV Tat-specific factor 1
MDHPNYTDKDGVEYEWDVEKKAYFPVLDQTLLEQQQSVYKTETKPSEKKKRKEPLPRKNTSVFVSNLPPSATSEDINSYFNKCGILMTDFLTHLPKIKMYYNEDKTFKGEALISYYKEESVDLAVTILDETEYSPGYVIKVQPVRTI